MLDIIILSKSSKKEVIETLNSILYQYIDIDYKIFILDYNKRLDYTDMVNDYKKITNIEELKYDSDNDIGNAKQKALDKTKNKYILFVNSGDVFSFPFAIDLLYKKIENDHLDMVFSNYFIKDDDSFIYKENDFYTTNSKIYRRDFIDKNKIKFNSTTINISYAFNELFFINNARVGQIEKEVYISKIKNNIINLYELDNISVYISDSIFLIEECKKKDLRVLNYLSLRVLYFSYFCYLIGNNKYLNNKIKYIIDVYDNNRLSALEETLIKKECLSDDLINILINSKITFDDYIEKMR